MSRLFTSESVTAGHPDKLCDAISDAVLDAHLARDAEARVAAETFASGNLIVLGGEVRGGGAAVDYDRLVRDTVAAIGYVSEATGLDPETVEVRVGIQPQSAEIAAGVDNSVEARAHSEERYDALGAGDQGIMFGYATRETASLMPAAITLAHALTDRLTEARRSGPLHDLLRPDAKSQVTLRYDDDGVPTTIETVLVSTQHADAPPRIIEDAVRRHVIEHTVEAFNRANPGHELLDEGNYIINPSGSFLLGGPRADAGLTGRKIIVDTYGGAARHGGGAFSGKDPSKVDRSAAYMLRHVAKHVVAAGLADRAELQVAYAIGRARPVGLYADTFGTGLLPDALIAEAVGRTFDLRPAAIADHLHLRGGGFRYAETAAGGHFGRPTFPWEAVSAEVAAALRGHAEGLALEARSYIL